MVLPIGNPATGWAGIVRLDNWDQAAADDCAEAMLLDANTKGYRDRLGSGDHEAHFVGALGEIAFAQYLGVPWACHPSDVGGRPDVAGYEVRTIPANGPRVYVKAKANDRPNTKVALVLLLHRNTAALIVGWMTAAQVREHGQIADPRDRGAPAWFVDDLRLLDRRFPERASA